MRFRAAIAFATVALALTGCGAVEEVVTTSGSVADEAALTTELAQVAAALEKTGAVQDVSTNAAIQEDLSFEVAVSAQAGDLDRDAAIAIAREIAAAFSAGALSRHPSTIEITTSDMGLMSLTSLDEPSLDSLEDTAAYWWEANELIEAPITLAVGGASTEHPAFRIFYSKAGIGDLSPLRELEVPEGAPAAWNFGALGMNGSVISEELEEAIAIGDFDDIGSFEDRSDVQRGVLWDSETPSIHVSYYRFFDHQDEGTTEILGSTYWPLVIDSIEAVVDAAPEKKLTNVTIKDASVHFGACPLTVTATPKDDALAALLTGDPSGLAAKPQSGLCQVTPPQ